MKHEKLTRTIIGAAMKVHSRLRPGLDESFYEKALLIELARLGLNVDNQREFPVHYEGHFLGKLIPDMVIENAVIADPKVATAFNDAHVAQMIGYLNITGLEVALLLNLNMPAYNGNVLWLAMTFRPTPTLLPNPRNL